MDAAPEPRRSDAATATVVHVVGPADTAADLGSGDLDVLGTPRLVAWCEEATVAALGAVPGVLPEGTTSVGTRIEIAHERASAVGATVRVRADLVHRDGRLVRFAVVAEQQGSDGAVVVVGSGEITRVVVDRARFLGRL